MNSTSISTAARRDRRTKETEVRINISFESDRRSSANRRTVALSLGAESSAGQNIWESKMARRELYTEIHEQSVTEFTSQCDGTGEQRGVSFRGERRFRTGDFDRTEPAHLNW